MEYLARDKKKAGEKADEKVAAREQEIAIAEGGAKNQEKRKPPRKSLQR
jgi:hypothetical protein